MRLTVKTLRNKLQCILDKRRKKEPNNFSWKERAYTSTNAKTKNASTSKSLRWMKSAVRRASASKKLWCAEDA
jgi:hypothetical protein